MVGRGFPARILENDSGAPLGIRLFYSALFLSESKSKHYAIVSVSQESLLKASRAAFVNALPSIAAPPCRSRSRNLLRARDLTGAYFALLILTNHFGYLVFPLYDLGWRRYSLRLPCGATGYAMRPFFA